MSAASGESSRRWRVVAEGPSGRAREFMIEGPSRVGRDPKCEICLEGRKISRAHLDIDFDAHQSVVVRDLNSHNGTHVNGKRITQAVLRGGETVQAGEWKIRFLPDRRRARSAGGEELPVITDDFGEEDLTLDLTDPAHTNLNAQIKALNRKRQGENWSWDQEGKQQPSHIHLAPLAGNPLVQTIRSRTTGHFDVGSLANLQTLAKTLDSKPPQESIETIALSLLYRVMAESHTALTLDDFLGSIADAILDATQGQGVAVLLPEGAFGEMQPRVIRLAERIRSLKLSQTVVETSIRDRAAVAAADASSDTRFASGESVLRLDLRAVLCVPLLRDDKVEGALYLTRERPFGKAEQDLVAALGHLVGLGIEQARLREQVQAEAALRSTLERFHTPEVVEKIMLSGRAGDSQIVEPFLESLEATVVFCDLSSFTAFSERHPPARVASLLNAYLARMTEVVFEHRGTVDKYIGDAVMAIFGAPFPGENDAVRAVSCALAMRSAFNAVIAERPPEERLRVRIGINTGPVVAGLIGSKLRLEYTALGDTVNVASRLEAAAEPGQILIGPRTQQLVKDRFLIQKRGPLALKGKAAPVEVYEVVGQGAIRQM